MNGITKFFKHLHTINRHRFLVCKYCFKLGLVWQGLTHDLSKYSFTEFWPSVKNFQGYRSPNEMEREKYGYSKAWLHHKGRNKHHFEYWSDFSKEVMNYVPVKMPIKYVKEMMCDRIAASKVYLKKKYNDSSALDYLTSHKDGLKMHQDTMKLITGWLEMLAQKGEKETFKYVRKVKDY